jgi:hypothetical protein
VLRTSLTFSSFERNCWQGRLSVASRVDTWQGSGNSTLTVLRIAARNVRWILFAGEPTYRGSGSCEMFADVLCVRGQLCKRLRNAARKPPKVDDAVAEQSKPPSTSACCLVDNACDHCAPNATSQNSQPSSCAHASNIGRIGGFAVQQKVGDAVRSSSQ